MTSTTLERIYLFNLLVLNRSGEKGRKKLQFDNYSVHLWVLVLLLKYICSNIQNKTIVLCSSIILCLLGYEFLFYLRMHDGILHPITCFAFSSFFVSKDFRYICNISIDPRLRYGLTPMRLSNFSYF